MPFSSIFLWHISWANVYNDGKIFGLLRVFRPTYARMYEHVGNVKILMDAKSTSAVDFHSLPAKLNLDLRSPTSAGLRRGVWVGWFRVVTLVALDASSVILSWLLAVAYGTPIDSPWTMDLSFLPIILAVDIGIITSRGLYKAGDPRRNYLGLIKAISLAEILLLLIAFLYEPNRYVSRSTFLLFWFFSIFFVCVGRFGVDLAIHLVRKKGIIRYSVFLITDLEDRERNIQLIEQENRYNLLGIADPGVLDRDNREELFASLRDLGVVEAFVSWNSIRNRLYLCWYFQTAGITLRILPSAVQSFFPKSESWMIGGIPSLTVQAPIIIGSDYWSKRCFDFCFTVTLLFLLFPLHILIAVLIKSDSPGPIFFRQTRIGLHGRHFKVWKFRTMVANADALQSVLEAKNEMKDGILFKMKDDPRITKIGKFLRRYSLDELPQLFNVLMGEMSFVGPRPLPIRDVEKFKEKHFIRQEILPGITGLWQVSGRSDIDNFDDAVKLDIAYIANWSLWLDLKIILQTVKVIFQKRGAY